MRPGLGATVLVGILAAGCTASPHELEPSASTVPVVKRGQMAPPFTLPEATGKPVALSDFHGRPVLLYFSMGPG